MANIGDQIREARKIKGMTQDALAEKLNVTRSAVANWEQNRRLPDAETLLRLSDVLEYSFESSGYMKPAESAPAASLPDDSDGPSASSPSPDESNDSGSDEPGSSVPDTSGNSAPAAVKPSRTKLFMILGAALAAVALLVWLVIVPMLRPAPKVFSYTARDGQVYTIERFKQPAENVPGKAYLRPDTTLAIMNGENRSFFLFTFNYREINGIGVTVDSVESCFFFDSDRPNLETFEDQASLIASTQPIEIPAFDATWTYTGGIPVMEKAHGVGIIVNCTDENGEKLQFPAYLSLGTN